MITRKTFLGASTLALLMLATSLRAGETYEASLKAGDAFRGSANYQGALTEYGVAVNQAMDATQTSLALGKKGYVQAFDLKDYPAARESATKALAVPAAGAVARDTALQVMAECLMQTDKDYQGASAKLDEALKLEGVEWASLDLNRAAGEAYRLSGRAQDAIAVLTKVTEHANASAGIKADAQLKIAFTYQYGLKDAPKAKAAYAKAVQLNPSLKTEVDGHLAKLP